MRNLIIYSFIIIFSQIISSCTNDLKIKLVEDFLSEKNIDKKALLVRFSPDDIHTQAELQKLLTISDKYLEIKHSDESIDSLESIVEIVYKKYRIEFKIINERSEIFIINQNGDYKIDYDATFNTNRYNIDSLFEASSDTVLVVRAFVSLGIEGRNKFKINNQAILNSLSDNRSNTNFYILDNELYKSIKSLYSNNGIRHLILKIKKVKDEDELGNSYVLDSIIQSGWIIK